MSLINVTNVKILKNPAPFTSPLLFTITFECLENIPDEIDWKLIYIGSSNNDSYDQELESFSMGPLDYGIMQFDLEAAAPDPKKIPKDELLGVTAIILSTSYKGKEFFRIGYYVYNNYVDPELLENPPEGIKIDALYRNIFVDKPRITRFVIEWGEKSQESDTSALLKPAAGLNSITQPSVFDINKEEVHLKYTQEEAGHKLTEEKCDQNPFFDNAMEIESNCLRLIFYGIIHSKDPLL